MKKYVDYAVKKIEELCKTPSPSGFTAKIITNLEKDLTKLGFTPEQTRKGALFCNLGGEGSPILFAAHVDTLGAMVRSIKGNGRMRYTSIGGYAANNIENENIIVHTRDGKEYQGTAYLINPAAHVYRDVNSLTRSETTIEIILDEEVKSVEDVKKLGIRVGDFISFDPRTVITKTGFIKSRHLDDKASSGILMALAKQIADKKCKPNRKIYILFTTYEEVGHGGSSGIPADVEEMISVDMGAVGDDLTTDEFKVSICAKDSGGPYDYDITTKLIKLAEANKLDHAVDIYPYYGSDVEATLRAGYDIKHGLIGPGVFASHGYERTHRKGVENTLKLINAYITDK
ncbi:MAG: M42 family metallopeptidase [Candidatus Zophobacter franzmannii]|jgi:putative aminopeptidase FrvX|nr:M42 family metallopeptidase [Candidatus Zophobacter franzmannii]